MSTTPMATRVCKLCTGECSVSLTQELDAMLTVGDHSYEPWRLKRLRELKHKYDPDNRFRFLLQL